MSDVNNYLLKVLADQNLADDSDELSQLRDHRKNVERLICDGFPDGSPTIRYGGSKAKGTLIREMYDLDVISYFLHDDTCAGKTLKEIYDNTAAVLEAEYYVERKTSALRLRSRDLSTYHRDLHIDVVPGRFVDHSKTDCYIHQENGDKDYQKTNLQVHIDHIRGSRVVPAIRLLKLWKVRRFLRVKQFVFELAVIEMLKGKTNKPLEDQLIHVWTTLRDEAEPVGIEDPANPHGNDLSQFLADAWPELSNVARTTLLQIEHWGWEHVFGKIGTGDESKAAKLHRAAAAVSAPTRPWGPKE